MSSTAPSLRDHPDYPPRVPRPSRKVRRRMMWRFRNGKDSAERKKRFLKLKKERRQKLSIFLRKVAADPKAARRTVRDKISSKNKNRMQTKFQPKKSRSSLHTAARKNPFLSVEAEHDEDSASSDESDDEDKDAFLAGLIDDSPEIEESLSFHMRTLKVAPGAGLPQLIAGSRPCAGEATRQALQFFTPTPGLQYCKADRLPQTTDPVRLAKQRKYGLVEEDPSYFTSK